MNSERLIRLMAGSLILISLAGAHFHSPHWLWLTLFVGANLFQSALTRWCLAEKIFIALGAKPCGAMEKSPVTHN
jgi:hypothetical protein